MLKKLACIILALTLLGISGCSLAEKANSTSASATTPASVRTVKEFTINKVWAVKQLEIDLVKEIAIELKLKDGDKVDGYFSVVKGSITGFNISGVSSIYASKSTDTETLRINSDRFSITASQGQGGSYTLTFNAATSADGKSNETTVYLELIYPATGSLYVPYGTK
jgi:hypothetical protein